MVAKLAAPAARLRRLFSTIPAAAGWTRLGRTALWLLPALLLFGWLGGLIGWEPRLSPQLAMLAVGAFLVPVLAEESLFRGLLLEPPSEGAGGLRPAALSALLFTLWNPLLVLLCRWTLGDRRPRWVDLGLDPWFLAAVFALGFACARLALATRSIWPGAVLHWAVLAGWLTLFGGPDLVGA
jgi:predicted Abi (CAAX) family protease